MKRAFVALASLVVLFLQPAHAAKITTDASYGLTSIEIEGPIEAGDFASFNQQAAALAGRKDIVVALKSPGGDLKAALMIGGLIIDKKWATFVYDKCESACAMIWLGGARRFISPVAGIGFHAASYENGGESGQGSAAIAVYMRDLGLSTEAVLWATGAGPSDIRWLTPEKAKILGIALTVLDPDTVLGTDARQEHRLPPPSTPAPPPQLPSPTAPTPAEPPADGPAPSTPAFNAAQWRDQAIGDAIARGYVVVKSWQTQEQSTGNRTALYLLVAWGRDRIVGIDYDAAGNANGGTVCDFDVFHWSECVSNTGNRYQMNQEAIGRLLRMGTTAFASHRTFDRTD